MNKAFFFIDRALRDMFYPLRFEVSDNYHPDKNIESFNFPYGLDYTTDKMLRRYRMIKDHNGIVMFPHYIDHKSNSSDTHYYSPVKIAHYALASFNDFLKLND